MQVTLIAAQSLDGFITRHDRQGSDFTSAADKAHFVWALRDFDCQIMGAETYRVWRQRTTGPVKPGRPQWVITRTPETFATEALSGRLEFTSEEPRPLLEKLAAAGFRRCALLGGSQIHRDYLVSHCVDELWLTIEPRIFGAGTPLASGRVDVQLSLISKEPLSADTLLLKYRVLKEKELK